MCILRFYKRLNEKNCIKWVFDYRQIDEKHTKMSENILNIHEYFMKKT